MSWLFLTEERVYKLKKPMRRAFLDFSSVAKRRFFCEEELRLNRRLAPETYLRVVPLCRLATGTFSLAGGGRIVDWLVEMKRLPQADMLDERIAGSSVLPRQIDPIAARLAQFYVGSSCRGPQATVYLVHLAEEQGINRSILLRPRFALKELATGPLERVSALLEEVTPELETRIATGALVEGHGDLRPEHVCLTDPPQIIDCLEFNRAMRIIDPYDEINYLGMECEMLGAPWIRRALNVTLEERFDQRPSDRLLALYGAFRALLRARLCVVHLLETPLRHPGRWRPLAIRYIEQAERELVSSRSREDRRSTRRRAGA